MIKRGVNFYSYQQALFFKQLDMESAIREVTENCYGADGVEINESLRGYPNPTEEYVEKWFSWLEQSHAKPVMMDTYMDVLQYRDHVMTYHECAERLEQDIRLAKRLGFPYVKTSAVVPFEIIREALPVAEDLGIRIGKEIHQPIPLNGKYVEEIIEYINKTGTKALGIVPDFSIFQFRPSEIELDFLVRHGASREACELVTDLCEKRHEGKGPLAGIYIALESAANVEGYFRSYLKTGETQPYYKDAFQIIKSETQKHIKNPNPMDYEAMMQALLYSDTKPEDIEPLVPYIVAVHGKVYNMTQIPGQPGHYEDKAVDNAGPIHCLKKCGFEGYINTEYEGQRKFQDLPFDQLANEVDQVRKHQEMLKRLIEEE